MARPVRGARAVGVLLASLQLASIGISYADVGKSEDGKALLPSQHSRSLAFGESAEEPLLVTTLDGKISAIDKESGKVQWTFDTESPLLSATDSHSYAFSIVPGVKGELYTQQRGLGEGFQLLPQTLPQWVEQTPSVMADGSLWLGSRHTHAFFVDARSGELIKSYVEYGDGPVGNRSEVAELPEDVQPILVGRVDYTVRAVNQETGEEMFTVSYSHLVRLDSEHQLPSAGDAALEGPQSLSSLGISVDAQQKTALVRTDSSGVQLWRIAFDQPPVAVFAEAGPGMSLHEKVALPISERPSISWLGSIRQQPQSIVVNKIGSSYYALPAARSKTGQEAGLHALLPAAEAEGSAPVLDACQAGELVEGQEDAAVVVGTRLGLHELNDRPSPLTARKAQGLNNTIGLSGAKATAGGFGVISLSVAVGAAVVLLWGFVKLTEKPRVIASMKDHKESDDLRTLTLSYTGTTEEAEDARRNSKLVMSQAPEQTKSAIKDWTGSGTEHRPEETGSSGQTASRGAGETTNTVEETPFSQAEAQTKHHVGSSGGGSFESPRSGSKKREERAMGQKDDEDFAEESGPEAVGDRAERRVHESADADKARREQESEPSTSGRSAENVRTFARRSEWRDGVTYIGRLAIGPGIIGYGSSGTLVFEGSLDGRQVAVKRVLRQFYQLARKEIGALIVADEHPNIVRCFAMEEDAEFVYLALERCKQSLNDLLGGSDPSSKSLFLDSERQVTAFCRQVCEEAGRGLMALHERGIVHRDLKPHNVLLTESNRTKLSDMGLCKRLTTDQTSYDSAGPGGSTGWQAPEQLILRAGGEVRQGRSVDIFTFGLLLFYCMTGGQHAFGEAYERDYRILNGKSNLEAISQLPEALNLVRAALRPQPKQRPNMAAVMAHPFWWPAAKKLAFLIDVSNRVENEDREVDRSLLRALESCAEEAICGSDWAEKLDPDLLANLGRYRKYNPGSLRDLLRVIRNKHNHFREMPEHLQEKLGPLPEGFLRYFTTRFPALLLASYAFALEHCSEEAPLQQYFPAAAKAYNFAGIAVKFGQNRNTTTGPPLLQSERGRTNSAPAGAAGGREPPLATVEEIRESAQRSKSESAILPPPPPPPGSRSPPQAGKHRGWWSSSDSESEAVSSASRTERASSTSSSASAASNPRPVPRFLEPSAYASGDRRSSPGRSSSSSCSSVPPSPALPPLPPTAASLAMQQALLFSVAPAGFAPPQMAMAAQRGSGVPDASGTLLVQDALRVSAVPQGVRRLLDAEGFITVFPQRMERDAPECDFFMKTGHCKFGDMCRFHHPLSASVKLTAEGGYPLRPGQPVCPFYDRTGSCKYAASCKFHHPSVPACRNSS